jgi:hypothetical protein
MGLTLGFTITPTPTPLDIANDGLTAVMNMNMFDRHFLLSLG